MKKIVVLIIVFQLSACAHDHAEFDKNLSGLRCDEAAGQLPGSKPLEKTADSVKYVGKNVAAYSYVGASYTTEVLWDVTAGVVMYVGLCAVPTIAVAIAMEKSGANGGSVCFPIKNSKGLYAPPLGRASLKATQGFRCPNLASVSHSLNRVADCYEKRGDRESLNKAVKSLENIELSKDFYGCLDPESQLAVQTRREELQKRILQN